MKELESSEPFEVSVGCPTITFELTEESLMLPWSSLACGSFKYGEIKLIFPTWEVKVVGVELDEVWKLLQMQDVRLLRSSGAVRGTESGGCQIHEIVAEKKADSDSLAELRGDV